MALRDIARRWGIVGAAILWLARIVSPGEVFAQAPSQPDASRGSSASPPVSSQPPAPAQQPRAQTKPRSRPAPPPAQPASDIPANPNVGNLSPPDKPEPVLHARNAGLGPCTRAVERGSAAVIDAPHSAFSNWNTGAPNLHAFQSIVVETYRSPLAPRAASVILASPSANGCDATAIQIFPSARPCAEVEKDILKSSSMIGNLAGLPLYQTSTNQHQVLMPTAGNGCVIVGVSVQFVAGAPPAPAADPSTRTPSLGPSLAPSPAPSPQPPAK